MINAMKPKLGDYSESLVDTPFNRKVQERLDYWNAKISKVSKEYKLYGFQQHCNTSNTIEILAMATKHCPKRLIGGNAKGFLSRHEKYPEGMISNYIGIGLNGEIAVGYKYLLEDLDSYMEQTLQKGEK